MKKAVIYARFSPRKNAAECVSIETQIDRCTAYCSANDMKVIAVHRDEALSGKRADNRPGLQAALADVCHYKGVLVVYSLSRLARNTKDAIEISEQLAKHGADLASLNEKIDTTSAMGKFLFRIMSALAELERDQISERTSDAMQRLQSNGVRMTHPDRLPYGWQLHPKDPNLMVPNKEEQEIAKKIVALRNGGASLRQIGRCLENEGIRCRGKPWNHITIRNILMRTE